MKPDATIERLDFLAKKWRAPQWAPGTARKLMKVLLVFLLLAFGPSAGLCAEADDPAPQAKSPQEATEGQTPGQETADVWPGHKLEEIVVTATRTAKSLSDVPAAVSVVTREDIESRFIERVDEAVNLLPGLFDKRAKGLDTTGRVVLRGMPDQRRTLVLLDGQPLNNGYTGQVDWNTTNPEDVERIEVARGPFSSLYGGNAMGGVINILTRMPEKREITLKGGYGSDNTWNGYGSYGDRFYDRLSVFASYGYKTSDGYPSDLVTVTPGTGTGTVAHGAVPTIDSYGNAKYIIGNKGDNHWRTSSGSIKLAYDLNECAKAYMSYRNNQYNYGYDDPASYLKDAGGRTIWTGPAVVNGDRLSFYEGSFLNGGGSVNENFYNAGYETRLFNDSVLKITGGLLDITDNWYVTPTSTAAARSGGPGKISETPSQLYFADMQLSIPVLEKHMLTVGGAFRYDEATNQETALLDWRDTSSKDLLTYQAEGKDNIFSFYTQAEVALLPQVTLYAGVRGDYWETYDGMANQVGSIGYPQYYGSKSEFSINPKGSVVFRPVEITTLRASIGTSFRPPNVYELYRTWTTSYGAVYQGNPNLNPETAFSWDVGVEQKLGSRSVFKLTYFKNTIDDFIYSQSVTPTLYVQSNAGKAQTDGVEMELETKPFPWLRLFSSATYTHSEMLENPAAPLTEGKQLVGIPEWMYGVGGEVTWRNLSFTATGRYASKQYSNDQNLDCVSGVYGSYDSFFLVDFYARYKLTKRATLDFAINNVMDEDYFAYYQAPGRQFFGGVTLRF